ncbi:serine hydrolase [Streptococcus suis]|uniref:serine hydrolase n=2 Tax=Streptococcus suis TaxID=1307 RepID=UPI000CF542DC|nr:serine hydrolase [Streptococcus suis]MBY4986642.1 class A beta-lactamase-related serine hydrolase [Streptococcus suis]MBY5039154.1 class A beta-lactamase-related serine hydrolase [Streptococcus suis]MCK3882951.1 serine hydrolase [Streptococcus suis]HEM6302601.1 serine hydrolase [Streptococcus suis]HEM6339753.1 serine hydrolase [Streptococcus suis]
MQKKLFIWILPALFSISVIDSTEIPFQLTAQEEYELTQTVYNQYFQVVPQNPNVFQVENLYSDLELTQVVGQLKPNQAFSITDVTVNSKKELVFQIDNASYIVADTHKLFDDAVLAETLVEQTYWTNKNITVLSSPISNQAKEVKTDLQSYQPVNISKIATTPLGDFAYVADKGWLDMGDLSATDNRMDAVQEMLNQKYSKDTIGVYVKQLSTGQKVGVNQDKTFYSASIAKLPILYYVQEQINARQVDLTTKVKYTVESMSFPGAYVVGGSGSLSKTPDNKEYSIEELINKTAKESDNVASNLLSYYVTNQFDDNFYQLTTAVTGSRWDMVTRETSAEVAGNMMEAIYYQNGYVLESLLSTQFDNQRISKDIAVPVAHKIGDADDVKHDVAIVYAESPFVLSIFTDKSSYDEITQIANDIYGILK